MASSFCFLEKVSGLTTKTSHWFNFFSFILEVKNRDDEWKLPTKFHNKISYNVAVITKVIVWFILTWPHSILSVQLKRSKKSKKNVINIDYHFNIFNK